MTALPAPFNAGGNLPGCDILRRIRAAGADAVLRDGKPVLTSASRVPAAVMADARTYRGELVLALVAELANDNATQPPPGDAPFINDPVERAATAAEHLPVRHLRKRPVSWARPADEPAPGDYCACCGSHLWWTETTAPKGWRCTRCHPPAHLQAGQFRAVAT